MNDTLTAHLEPLAPGREASGPASGRAPDPGSDPPEALSICLVSHAFWPFDRGGVETYVHGLATALLAGGHRAAIFHPFSDPAKPDGLVEEDTVAGVDVVRINRPVLNPHQEFGDPTVEAALRRVLWERRVDVTHFHHLARGLSASLIETAWLAGTRVVLTVHDAWIGCPKGKEIDIDGRQCSGPTSAAKCGRCLTKNQPGALEGVTAWVSARNSYLGRVLPLCDLITSPSRYQAEMLGRAPWLRKAVTALPTGIDVRPHRPVPARAPDSADAVRVGVMSNFIVSAQGEDFKGAAVLARAAALLPAGGPVIEVYGSADESSSRVLGESPNLVLHGPYEADRTDEILDGLDCLVLPSLIENYPTVVREAFSRRVPVISSDAGGLPELVLDGVNGLLVPAGDAAALAGAIAKITSDRRLLTRLREGTAPPLTITDDAAGWAGRYRQLSRGSDAPGSSRITVVVATYDRPAALRRCLDGFVGQTMPRDRFEVIVVDDAPHRPAADVVSGYGDLLDIRYVPHPENRGLGEARRTGVRAATGEVVLFFDDDDIPGPRLLAEHAAAHRRHHREQDAVLGFTAVHPDVDMSPAMYHALMVGQEYFSYPALEDGMEVPWHCGWGGRTSYKTSLLRREEPRGRWLEDSDLNARLRPLGLSVHYNRRAVQYLTDSLNDVRLFIRARHLGAATANLLAANPDPQLAALMGGHDPLATWRQLAPAVPQAESATGQLASHGLGALRRTDVAVEGRPTNAEALLHRAYSILLAEANLAGRLIEERRRRGGSPTFAALPDWLRPEAVRDVLDVFLTAFEDRVGVQPELYLCLPVGSLAPELAVSLVNDLIAGLGRDPTTVPPVRILHFDGTQAQDLDAVWLRSGWGAAATPGPSIRVVEGPDALRRAVGASPRSEALK